LIDGDFAELLALRDRIGELDRRLTARRAAFTANSDELAAFVRDELEKAQHAVKNYQAQLEQRVEERTLQRRHLAEHDPLTNLPTDASSSVTSTSSRRSTTASGTSSAIVS